MHDYVPKKKNKRHEEPDKSNDEKYPKQKLCQNIIFVNLLCWFLCVTNKKINENIPFNIFHFNSMRYLCIFTDLAMHHSDIAN